MKKLVLVDPHSTDQMFTPLMFKIFGRKALRKYSYIPTCILSENKNIPIYLSYNSSSLPARIFEKLPFFLRKIIVDIEIKIWKKINDGVDFEITHNLTDKKVFFFGHKKSNLISDERFKDTEVTFIHLSHYHGFASKPVPSLELQNKIVFCFDNDIKEHTFFKSKFSWYKKDIEVVTFEVQERFFSVDIEVERMKKCCITGTYHSYDKQEMDWGIYNRNFTTLHPVRHELALKKLPNHIDSKLSLFRKPDLIKFKLNDIGQSKYFSFDIAEYYSKYSYACIPGEGTGAIGIGSLEAMASGCKVFLTDIEAKGLKFPTNSYIAYENTEDLLSKIEYAINNISIGKIDRDNFRNIAKGFNHNSLIEKFDCIIKRY